MHSVCFAGTNNALLLGGDQSGKVMAWSLASHRPAASWMPYDGLPVLSVHELCQGQWLTQGKGGLLCVWDGERVCNREKNAETASVKVELHSFCKCEPLDSTTVAVPVGDGVKIGIWDTRSDSVQPIFSPGTIPGMSNDGAGGGRGPTGMCMCLGMGGEGKLVGGYEDGSVHVWDLRSRRVLYARRVHDEPVFGVCGTDVSVGSKQNSASRRAVYVSGGADGMLSVNDMKSSATLGDAQDVRAERKLRDGVEKDAVAERVNTDEGESAWRNEEFGETVTWKEAGKFETIGEGLRGISSVHIRPDAKIIAAGCWDGRVRVYSIKKPRALASMACHAKGVQCVRFSRDSRLLASCSEDTRIAVWEIYPPT